LDNPAITSFAGVIAAWYVGNPTIADWEISLMDTSMSPVLHNARPAVLLDRIAAALDCPVSAFTSHPLDDRVQTSELLRLWFMVEHEHDRAAVLTFLERAVEAQAINTTVK
jgi:predicted oxidoreductase